MYYKLIDDKIYYYNCKVASSFLCKIKGDQFSCPCHIQRKKNSFEFILDKSKLFEDNIKQQFTNLNKLEHVIVLRDPVDRFFSSISWKKVSKKYLIDSFLSVTDNEFKNRFIREHDTDKIIDLLEEIDIQKRYFDPHFALQYCKCMDFILKNYKPTVIDMKQLTKIFKKEKVNTAIKRIRKKNKIKNIYIN